MFPHSDSLCQLADEGLVGYGADLSVDTLLQAYRQGIFPWFNAADPILWWCPNPRCIIYPSQFKASKSLLRTYRKQQYSITFNQAFAQVVTACAAPRAYSASTWIGNEIINAYCALNQQGHAYSIEVWDKQSQALVGGLYFVNIGMAVFGESMFSKRTDTSKLAFAALMSLCKQLGIAWVDCQLVNDHLLSLGAKAVERTVFLQQLLPQQVSLSTANWGAIHNPLTL